ncbi:MAG: hypothetical protein WCP21_22150 [Armatimonadota bacterium]
MTAAPEVEIKLNPELNPRQLFDFYTKNNICEAGYGEEIAARPLSHSSLIVAAFRGEELVAIARAMFDGLSADLAEFCLALELQGTGLIYDNGSLIEKDDFGVGKRVGEVLLRELQSMGADFISTTCLEDVEERFYAGLGLRHNPYSLEYILDRRPYVD